MVSFVVFSVVDSVVFSVVLSFVVLLLESSSLSETLVSGVVVDVSLFLLCAITAMLETIAIRRTASIAIIIRLFFSEFLLLPLLFCCLSY